MGTHSEKKTIGKASIAETSAPTVPVEDRANGIASSTPGRSSSGAPSRNTPGKTSGSSSGTVNGAEDRWVFELKCTGCGRLDLLTQGGVFEFLRSRRRIRATTDASPDILIELFLDAVPKSFCSHCHQKKLTAVSVKDDSEDTWGDVGPVLCEDCGKPIPPERLAIVPETRVCVQCKRLRERDGIWGQGEYVSGYDSRGNEGDYCPRCGAPMRLKASGGDRITRYISVCSAGCRPREKN